LYRKEAGACFPKVLLFNGKNFATPPNDIYLKVPKAAVPLPELLASRPTHECKVTEEEAYPSSIMLDGSTSKFKFGYFLTSTLTLLVIEVVLILVGCWVV